MEALATGLNDRRKALKMPLDELVRRSRVPRAVVVRILRGNADAFRFGQFQKVAGVLGLPYGSPSVDPEEVRHAEARKKARLLLEERTVARLLEWRNGDRSPAKRPSIRPASATGPSRAGAN